MKKHQQSSKQKNIFYTHHYFILNLDQNDQDFCPERQKKNTKKRLKFPEGYLYSHFKWEVSHPKFTLIHNFITNPSNPDCEDLYDENHLETFGKF